MPPSFAAPAFVTVPMMWPAAASVASMPEVVAPAVTPTSAAASIVAALL